MPKRTRLTRKDFPALGKMRRVHGAFFSASVAPNERSKVSCIVAKKVASKASVRNLIKRRARAALSQTMPAGLKAIVILHAKHEVAKATFADIKKDIGTLMKKIAETNGA